MKIIKESNYHPLITKAAKALNLSEDDVDDIINGAIEYVNDTDINWEYNTPELFANAVGNRVVDQLEDGDELEDLMSSYPNATVNEASISALYDAASCEDISGLGDFDV